MAIMELDEYLRLIAREESNPLFDAVLANDLNMLKNLFEAGNSVNINTREGTSLLNFVMTQKSVEIFDYLMSLDETDVNSVDGLNWRPLLFLADLFFDEYFALELIRRGADIHLNDEKGFTFLHIAARSVADDNLEVGRVVIEKGANINEQTHDGITPLYAACEVGNYDWICMLLYYGADANIPTDEGVLPLAVISQRIAEDKQLELQEILFNYTFDENTVEVQLPTLVKAMTHNSSLFPKILEHTSNIIYDVFDLEYMVDHLIHLKLKHLQLFFEKYGHIIRDIVENFPPLDALIKIALDREIGGLKDVIDVFLYSDYISEFVQSSDLLTPTISNLLEAMNCTDQFIEEDEFTTMVSLMLSYGVGVTSTDLDAVYNCYGYCELFKILLHMDIVISDDRRSIAFIFYNPLLSIDDLLLDASLYSTFLYYYNHPKLKEYVLANSQDSEILERVNKLPHIPRLIELSRNAARKYIVERFSVENSVQFHTVLKWLPIGEMNRRIIALEKKLY